MWGLFPGTPSLPDQSSKIEQHTEFVTTPHDQARLFQSGLQTVGS
jgi:hypothetical protein